MHANPWEKTVGIVSNIIVKPEQLWNRGSKPEEETLLKSQPTACNKI